MKRSLGFTLIELMIVIAIIGILAAIVVPAVSNTGAPSKSATPPAQQMAPSRVQPGQSGY